MTKAFRALKLPEPVMREAERLAASRGQSVDEWIAATVERRISVEAQFLEKGRGATARAALDILRKLPEAPPADGDELPSGWSPV